MYDVIAMKRELAEAARATEERIRGKFKAAFLTLYQGDKVPNTFTPAAPKVTKKLVRSLTDLKAIPGKAGFYIILSTHPVAGNNCRLRAGNLRAVYRGECATVKERVMSHLFHRRYKEAYEASTRKYEEQNHGKSYYREFWPHCLKLDDGGPSGIDIDRPPYSDHRWMVIVHHMEGSSQQVRKLAELAFDDAFDHPEASRDV